MKESESKAVARSIANEINVLERQPPIFENEEKQMAYLFGLNAAFTIAQKHANT